MRAAAAVGNVGGQDPRLLFPDHDRIPQYLRRSHSPLSAPCSPPWQRLASSGCTAAAMLEGNSSSSHIEDTNKECVHCYSEEVQAQVVETPLFDSGLQ